MTQRSINRWEREREAHKRHIAKRKKVNPMYWDYIATGDMYAKTLVDVVLGRK